MKERNGGMFKSFFVHGNHQPGHLPNRAPRGFTAFIQPTDSPRVVRMNVTFCSPKDEFNKKIGRAEAMKEDGAVLINKRHVPDMLAKVAKLCDLIPDPDETYYMYVLKRMI